MKVQWMNMSPDQISRFNKYRDHKILIGKYQDNLPILIIIKLFFFDYR